MSRGQAKAAPRQTAEQRGRSLWSKLATLVFLLPAAAVLLPTTIVIAVMLLPTIAAYLVDRVPGRSLAVTVGLMNGAGAIPAIASLWVNGHDLLAAQWVLSDLMVWLWAYGTAACGWLIFLSLPPLLRRYFTFATQSRIRGLQRRQEQLREEWGSEVTGMTEGAEDFGGGDKKGATDNEAHTKAAAAQENVEAKKPAAA